VLPAFAVGCILVVIVSEYLKHGEKAGNLREVTRPLSYVLLQTACAAAAIYRTRLYLVALTMHYVEYHLLMSPRIFSKVGARGIRSSVVAFYVALIALVIAFEARTHVALPSNLAPLVHVFDGIFVVHYFVEAFVWKFTNPFYRERLVPLYVGSGGTPGSFSAKLPAFREMAAVALVTAVAGGALFHDNRLSAAFDRGVVRRMRAQLELEWGADFAQSGEIRRATDHFERAVALDPHNRDAERALARARPWRSRILTEAGP
jgi:hypothetical protein